MLQVLFLAVASGFAFIFVGERARLLISVMGAMLLLVFRLNAMAMWTAPTDGFGALAVAIEIDRTGPSPALRCCSAAIGLCGRGLTLLSS